MRDVVYIVGNGSRWNNNELRYSLRSIDKYGIGLGRVFIIGSIPKFINRSTVTCIPMQEKTGVPAKNVYIKIKAAIDNPEIGEEFLLSSDDHFFIRPTDFINYPIYYKSHNMPRRGDEHTGKYGGGTYTKSMIDTREVMEQHGLGCMYFEGHTDKLYSKAAWRELEKLGVWKSVFAKEKGISTNSPMAAMYCKMHPKVTPQHRKDIKIHDFDSWNDIHRILSDTDSFSIADSAVNSGIGDYLSDLFPYPSKYEK